MSLRVFAEAVERVAASLEGMAPPSRRVVRPAPPAPGPPGPRGERGEPAPPAPGLPVVIAPDDGTIDDILRRVDGLEDEMDRLHEQVRPTSPERPRPPALTAGAPGEPGTPGPPGRDGASGRDGAPGRDGRDSEAPASESLVTRGEFEAALDDVEAQEQEITRQVARIDATITARVAALERARQGGAVPAQSPIATAPAPIVPLTSARAPAPVPAPARPRPAVPLVEQLVSDARAQRLGPFWREARKALGLAPT